jgi:hypothetical protein
VDDRPHNPEKDMENAPSFDLEATVLGWRDALRGSPALRDTDLDELEAHLRDSVLSLESSGRRPEEAFQIACQRLGSLQEIEREYCKVNRGRVWLDRCVWMLLGLLLFRVIGWLCGATSQLVVHGLVGRVSPHWLGLVSSLADAGVTALLAVGFWRLVTRRGRAVRGFIALCLTRPLLPFLALVLVNYSGPALLRLVRFWPRNIAGPDMAMAGPILNLWSGWSWPAEMLLWTAALIWLARRRWMTGGLNLDRAVWAERAVWMIAGMLISQHLLGYLTFLPDLWVTSVAQAWTLSGQWLGLAAVCLQWSTVLVGVAILARLVVTGDRWLRPVVRFGLRQPVIGTVGLIAVIVGIAFGLMLLGPHIPEQQGWDATRVMIAHWSGEGRAALYNVLSVALLLALARRRWGFRNSWV